MDNMQQVPLSPPEVLLAEKIADGTVEEMCPGYDPTDRVTVEFDILDANAITKACMALSHMLWETNDEHLRIMAGVNVRVTRRVGAAIEEHLGGLGAR